MRRFSNINLFAVGACLVAGLFSVWGVLQAASAAGQPRVAGDIPTGYDFPAEETGLLALRDTQNVAGMRNHVWQVFAGMTQPTIEGKPIWTTWYYRDEVFGDRQPEGASLKFDKPTQLELGHVLETQDSLPSIDMRHQIPTVNLYNASAYSHIRENKYHVKAALQELIKPDAQSEVKPFPRTAIVLKTIWWPVKKDELTSFPVWDQNPLNPPQQDNGYTTFGRIVAIDPLRAEVPEGETTDNVRFHNPQMRSEIIARSGSRVLSLRKFYHFALTADGARQANESVSPYVKDWFGREVREGDYAALVGLHMTTREIPDWTWATFWWHDNPTAGLFANDRPDKVSGVWRNYLMSVSYSMETPKEPDGTAHIAFNPYLEGPFSNGITSNCMTCHRKAVWPTKRLAADNPLVNPFTVSRETLSLDAPMFKNRVASEYLWSIPLHSK